MLDAVYKRPLETGKDYLCPDMSRSLFEGSACTVCPQYSCVAFLHQRALGVAECGWREVGLALLSWQHAAGPPPAGVG